MDSTSQNEAAEAAESLAILKDNQSTADKALNDSSGPPLSAASSDLSEPPDLGDVEMDLDDASSLSPAPSDDEMAAEPKTNAGNKRPHPHTDSDEASDYERPKKKKTKRKTETKGTGKKSHKKNTAKTAEPKKSKIKKKVNANADANEDESVKKGRKQLLARSVEWQDLPEWGERTDCPLLDLPVEVLDAIFAPRSGLQLRDYVSLAGVSKMFRLRFTPSVFHGIACFYDVWTADAEAKRIKLNRTDASRIFSRDITDWRVYPPTAAPPTITHYVPDGSRETWSQAQYIVYKEEQGKWRAKERTRKLKQAEIDAEYAAKSREARKKRNTIRLGAQNRKVLGAIDGRKDGEPPVAKDKRGLPLPPVTVKAEINDSVPAPSPTGVVDDTTTATATKSKVTKLSSDDTWVVPESEDEEEKEERPIEWDYHTGERTYYDPYPNPWRKRCVEAMTETYINKTEAMREYKVTEAELLCLRCTLIPNSMNSKSPQQAPGPSSDSSKCPSKR